MHLKKLKFIIATALTAVMIGLPISESVYAAESTENNTSIKQESNLVQAQEVLENIEINDELINNVKAIDSSTNFINGNYVLDEGQASQLGLSQDRIKSVQASYSEINDSINKGLVKVSEDGSKVISEDNQISARSIDPIIFSVKISAKKCTDIASLLTIGAGVAAVAAGIASFIPGINAIAVPILTIAGGVITIGAGAFAYAGNHNGTGFRVYKSGKVRLNR